MSQRKPLPRGLNRPAFSVKSARDAGVTRWRLDAKDVPKSFHGTRSAPLVVVATDTRDRRLRRAVEHAATEYAQRMSRPQAFSHLTAAALLGLRLPDDFTPLPLHVSAAAPSRAPRGRGASGHTMLAATPLTTLPSRLRVTTALATFCALGETLPLDDLIVLGDSIVRRQNPFATIDELRAAVAACAGRPGVTLLRAALEEIRPGTDSNRETLLRLMIVRAGFPEPEVNGRIDNEYGAFVAFGDLLYRKQKVVLEYDGSDHRENERQFNRDVDRLDDLMALDYRVIRVNKSLMARRAVLFGKLRTALDR